MIIASKRLGSVEIEENDVLHFPEGVLGFGDLTRYALVAPKGAGDTVRVLQALEDEAVSFIVTDPKAIRPDYAPRLSPEDWAGLGLNPPVPEKELEVWAILTVYDDPGDMTVNLLAPVVIHRPSKVGRQVIQRDTEYSVRHNVVEELARLQATEVQAPQEAEKEVAAAHEGPRR